MARGEGPILPCRGQASGCPDTVGEETVPAPPNGLGTVTERHWATDAWFYSGLCSAPLLYVAIPTPSPHGFGYRSFVESSEVGKGGSPNRLYFQDCFGLSGPCALSASPNFPW